MDPSNHSKTVTLLINDCNNLNNDDINRTDNGSETNDFKKAYRITDTDFKPGYHFNYTSQSLELRECGPNKEEKWTVPDSGWIKIALQTRKRDGTPWGSFSSDTEKYYTAFHGVRNVDKIHRVISSIIRKGKVLTNI